MEIPQIPNQVPYQEKKPINIDGFQHISTVVEHANRQIEAYQAGKIRAFITFSSKLNDKIKGIYPDDIAVIAARTGVGKSTFANKLIKSIVELNPWAKILVLYWSMEMPSYQQIVKIYSSRLGKPFKTILSENTLDEPAMNLMKQEAELLKKHHIYFRDLPITPAGYKSYIERAQALFPEYTILNLFDHTRLVKSTEAIKKEEEKITALMDAANEMKNKFASPSIFLTQMNRNIESGKDRRDIGTSAPIASDIFGADSVAQYATLVIALHRPELYGLAEYVFGGVTWQTKNFIAAHILKQRFGWLGMLALAHKLEVNEIFDLPIQSVKF